jgi:Zn-dependent M28 family amino/carboxypeptidase
MKKRNFILLISAFALLSGFNTSSNRKVTVSEADLREWISYLASDEMRGRANGSPEMKAAAEWIAGKFSEFGLKPLFADGSYLQNYTYTSRQRTVNERNVAGVLEGTDPVLKDQYIIVSSHFDHVGVRKGNVPDSIYNGADDNAAGTSTVIAVANAIREHSLKPGRSIIFASFSGEENGMRGSRYFVSRQPVPYKNIYVNINFEMTGHSEYLGRNNYYMTGTNFSNLDELIGEFNKNNGFRLIDTISMARNLFFASDNIAFSRMMAIRDTVTGIPSGTFATTALADYIHSPDDEAELFDFTNMAALAGHFTELIIWLSNSRTDIIWTDPKFRRPVK